jgi:hypothetical protein
LGARERTLNMEPMCVTLEVSKLLSGWLNTLAPCRVEERAYTMRSEVRAGRRKSVWVRWLRRKRCDVCTARGPETQGLGARARAHREHGAHARDLGGVEAQRLVEHRRPLVSQREGGHVKMRSSEVRAGRREGVERCGGASGMHGEGPRLGEGPTRGGPDSGLGGQGAHPEHVLHARDLGGVEAAERLVE